MCSFETPMQCLNTETFRDVAHQCEPQMKGVIEHFAPYLGRPIDAACGDAGVDADMTAAFSRSGVAMLFLRCALLSHAGLERIVGHLSWPAMRNLFCPHPPVGEDDAAAVFEPSEALRWTRRVGFGLLLLCVAWILLRYQRPLTKVHRWRGATLVWWAAFAILAVWGTAGPTEDTQLEGFYYRDESTQCGFEILERVPNAILTNHVLSVVAPNATAAVLAYRAVLDAPVNGSESLRAMCGFCDVSISDPGPHDPTNVTLALLAEDEGATSALLSAADETGGGSVVFSFVLPPFVHASWVRQLLEALPSAMPEGTAWLNNHQIQADVRATTASDAHLSQLSALAVFVLLNFGVYRSGRGAAGTVALVVCTLASLGVSLVIAQRLSALLRIPDSPYATLVVPIVLGNGVDSVLVMLAARDKGFHKWAIKSCPSIVASQVSTMCCFVVGLAFSVAHFTSFFTFAILSLLTSCAMQVTLFPTLITLCTSRASSARPEGGVKELDKAGGGGASATAPSVALSPRAWRRLGTGLLAATAVAWTGLLVAWRPVHLSFELLTNLHSETTTYRFFRDAVLRRAGAMAPILALLRSDGGAAAEAAGAAALAGAVRALNGTLLPFWRDAFVLSGEGARDEWFASPVNEMIYGNQVSADGQVSVATMLAPYTTMQGDAYADYDFVRALHARSDENVCFVSYERLGAYTIVKTYRSLWLLVLASACFSAVAGTVITKSPWAGAASVATLAGTFLSVFGVLGAFQVHVHIMVVAALVVLPGVIVDYVLHLTFAPDTLHAVFFSCLTSAGGFLPYAFSSTSGIRDFTTVFILGTVSGLLFAVLAVSASPAVRYDPVSLGGGGPG
jgi:hypothetical protein